MGTLRRLFSSRLLKGRGEVIRIDARESHHGRDVLRLRPGDHLAVFDETGRQFGATVEGVKDKCLVVVLGEPVAAAAETTVPIMLYIALAKSAAFEAVLQKAIELGAAKIVPFDCERCVVKMESGAALERKMERWRRIVLGATKQSGRARQAIIAQPCSFEEAAGQASGIAARFCCTQEADVPRLSEQLRSIDRSALQSLAVMIGPEGGLTPSETAFARQHGWRLASLGPRTLRVETAATVAQTLLLSFLNEI